MTEAYKEIDPNMIIETKLDAPDIRFHDIRKPPFNVYGLYDYQNQPFFRRMPEDVAAKVSPGVARLERECTGGRVRFTTDSQYVAIHVDYINIGRSSHLTLASSAGFDLYEDTPEDSRFIRPLLPPYDMKDFYEQIQRFATRKLRSFTINFPVHSVVKNLYVGLQQDAVLQPGRPYRDLKPIIFYGSSIVHGTAATRPGLTYENIISRKLKMDFVNYGFSGQAKGEPAIAEYLAEQPMSIFVCDYDHNAPNVEHLAKTHFPFYEIIRAKNPDVPYVMISRPNVATNPDSAIERRDVVIDSFRKARAAGDKNVYYIDGETFFLGEFENECTMDGVHPNDLGFTLMANSIGRVLTHILRTI